MFKFAVIIALAAVSSAHYIPSSYQKVILYKLVPVQQEAPKWEEPKWEAPKWQEAPKVESWTEKAKNEWEQKEQEKPANYDFKYEVHDEKTGDIKRQSETASNGAVKGQYSLIDSDGFRRVVDYTADDHHGFQATVKREPTSFKVPVPAPKPQQPKWEEPKWEEPKWQEVKWEAPKPQEPKWEEPKWEAPKWQEVQWEAPKRQEAPKVESWTEKAKNEWEQKEQEKPANYDFKYEVHDEKTGDIKRQSETASNGAVKGQYSLIDSDGFRRVVDYTADDHHGFQATVKREPTSFKVPVPAPKPQQPKWEEPKWEAPKPVQHWW